MNAIFRLKSFLLIACMMLITVIGTAQSNENFDFPSYDYSESSADYYSDNDAGNYYYDEDPVYTDDSYYEDSFSQDYDEEPYEQPLEQPQEPVKPAIEARPPINLGEKSIRIGRIPYMSIKTMMAQTVPLLRHLQKKTGAKEVRLVSSGKNYSTILEALARENIDFAWVGPTAYLNSSKSDELMPIAKARFGNDTAYCGVFIAPVNGCVQGLEDLVDSKIGFVDPESASGYIYPRYLLNQLGIKFTKKARGRFLKSHDKVLQAVLAGKVDAGVCLEATLNAYKAKDKDLFKKIIILAKTPEIPSDVIVCRKDCPINLRESFLKALIELKASDLPAGSPTFLPAFEEEFASVEAIMRVIGMLKE